MLRITKFFNIGFNSNSHQKVSTFCYQSAKYSSAKQLPKDADVVIIGGGSAGCHVLYNLSKLGVKACLLERAKLTAGTTWHTAGLIWRLRPNDVEIQLLNNSRNMLKSLEKETGYNPGWIQNGGIFIAHSKTRMDEYKRLASIGKSLDIENYILTPEETQKLFPLLDKNAFIGSLYSPGDGVVDPAMLCTALTKYVIKNGGCQVIEECPIDDILIENFKTSSGDLRKKVIGVQTPYGVIKTNVIVNATGVWGRDLVEKHGVNLPLVPMRHSYVVTEPIPKVRGTPNIRDHDYSIYFRIQGESICMGGYEANPILIDRVPKDFHFSLYDLDWETFNEHINGTIKICPKFGKHGIKSVISGPESFTPDHKPLMGPDTDIHGLFHHCGFNSAGMMFGGGCGEQLALWIVNGKPDLSMFQFDVRRFTKQQTEDKEWITQRSHEAYAKNYSIVFPHDQPLAGRNFKTDPLHNLMLAYNAWMDEKQGWERPSFFMETEKALVLPYDWYGSYGNKANVDAKYNTILEGNLKYEFSDFHDLIGKEALNTRTNASVFNTSYFCKMYLTGPEAVDAANWIFTGNVNSSTNKTTYTCVLNDHGGVEADLTVSKILPTVAKGIHCPKLNVDGFYIVSGGASGHYTYSYILSEIIRKGFNANLKDVTEDLGIMSVQGPKSRKILQRITDFDLSNESLPPNHHKLISVYGKSGETHLCRLLRVSFVGELGYELHVTKQNCPDVYTNLMEIGKEYELRNAGYRALYSLSSEKGYHLWGFDLRSDDTPIEAGLGFTCRRNGEYKGKNVIDKQRIEGVQKKLVCFTMKDRIPIWGLEGVYRNGEPVGALRRGEYAYYLDKSFGQGYIVRKDGKPIDNEFILKGKYQIDVLGKLYDVDCHLKSPFDPDGKRLLGVYES